MERYPFEAAPPLKPRAGMRVRSKLGGALRVIEGESGGGWMLADPRDGTRCIVPLPALRDCWREEPDGEGRKEGL